MNEELLPWFQENKRWFPWRENPTPYRVWVSEVMLQQTRSSVVIPYFLSWMGRFPDVRTLAHSSEEEVVKAWEGMGYYRRVIFLRLGAQKVLDTWGGKIPSTLKDLLSIPGIGLYTAGAILSFAFHRRAVAIDGNVVRVASRLWAIENRVDHLATRREIKEKVETALDLEQPWISMEALIELGATVCLPRPKCDACPLKRQCRARQKGKELSLPLLPKREEKIFLKRRAYLFLCDGYVLVRKETGNQVMRHLYEFPYVEGTISPFQGHLFSVLSEKEGVTVRHSFTKFQVELSSHIFKVSNRFEVPSYTWVSMEELKQLPFSSGHRKLIEAHFRSGVTS